MDFVLSINICNLRYRRGGCGAQNRRVVGGDGRSWLASLNTQDSELEVERAGFEARHIVWRN